MSDSYGGVYEALVVSDSGSILRLAIPQVFGETQVTCSRWLGPVRPPVGQRGYVSFIGADPAWPVWLVAGTFTRIVQSAGGGDDEEGGDGESPTFFSLPPGGEDGQLLISDGGEGAAWVDNAVPPVTEDNAGQLLTASPDADTPTATEWADMPMSPVTRGEFERRAELIDAEDPSGFSNMVGEYPDLSTRLSAMQTEIDEAPVGSMQWSIWTWTSTVVTAPLPAGRAGINRDLPAAATQMWIHPAGTINAIDWSNVIKALRSGDKVYMQKRDDAVSIWYRWTVTGTPVTTTLYGTTNWLIPIVGETGSATPEPANGVDALIAFKSQSGTGGWF